MIIIQLFVENAPQWLKDDKRALTNSVLVDCRGDAVVSTTDFLIVSDGKDIDEFVEMLSHLSMTHILASYSFGHETTLELLPSLDGNTNIDAEMISNMAMRLFGKKI